MSSHQHISIQNKTNCDNKQHWEAKQKENMYLPSYPKQTPPQGTVIISNMYFYLSFTDPYVIQNLLFFVENILRNVSYNESQW